MVEDKKGLSIIEAYKQQLASTCGYVLADEIPSEGVDVVFFHGRAPGDEGMLFPFMRGLYDKGLARQILIPGTDGNPFKPNTDPKEQYEKGDDKYTINPGKAVWARMLDEVGFDLHGTKEGVALDPENGKVIGNIEWGELTGQVATSGPGVRNTKEENETVLAYLQEHGLKRVALVAHPHQLPRAMLGMVATLNVHNVTDVKVYTVHPNTTDWDEIVPGSQGKGSKPRRLHGNDEMSRVPTYQKNGRKDLASFLELKEYYDRRDGGPERMQQLLDEKQGNLDFQTDVRVLKDAIESLSSERLTQLLSG